MLVEEVKRSLETTPAFFCPAWALPGGMFSRVAVWPALRAAPPLTEVILGRPSARWFSSYPGLEDISAYLGDDHVCVYRQDIGVGHKLYRLRRRCHYLD